MPWKYQLIVRTVIAYTVLSTKDVPYRCLFLERDYSVEMCPDVFLDPGNLPVEYLYRCNYYIQKIEIMFQKL